MILGVGYTPFLMRFRLIFSVLGVEIPVGGGTSMVNEWRSRASPSGANTSMDNGYLVKRGSANTHISERALRAVWKLFFKTLFLLKNKKFGKVMAKYYFLFLRTKNTIFLNNIF